MKWEYLPVQATKVQDGMENIVLLGDEEVGSRVKSHRFDFQVSGLKYCVHLWDSNFVQEGGQLSG